MKTVEVSESALESLKAMVVQLQGERDELLKVADLSLQFMCIASDWNVDEAEIDGEFKSTYDLIEIVKNTIAKCTQTQSICDWQEKMNG